MLGGAAFLLNFAPDRITLVQDLNIQMVGGRNENGYRRQCGVPVAVVGHRSRKGARKATDKAAVVTRALWQRSSKLYDRRVCLSRGDASHKDRAQRSDDGENEHDDGSLKIPI